MNQWRGRHTTCGRCGGAFIRPAGESDLGAMSECQNCRERAIESHREVLEAKLDENLSAVEAVSAAIDASGLFDLRVTGVCAALVASALHKLFMTGGGKNYVAIDFAGPTGQRFEMVLQKVGAVTPAAKNDMLTKEVATLRERLAEAHAEIRKQVFGSGVVFDRVTVERAKEGA